MQKLCTNGTAETKFHHKFSAFRNTQNCKKLITIMFHERTNKVKLCTKVLFTLRKLSMKDNLHNTRKATKKIAGGIHAFAEYKRTIDLIYLLKILIFQGMSKAKIPSITNLF